MTERDFKGVWIPREIWLDNNLGWSAKLLLVEIDSLEQNGECFASNEHFAKFFGLSKDRISKLISELKEKGYIEVKLLYRTNTKQIEKRIITTRGYRQKQLEGIGENNYTPIGENAEDNNTSIINTSNNTKNNINIDQIEQEFSALWAMYPRKVGKDKARKAYLKERKSDPALYETVAAGINAYIDYINKKKIEAQYIKHGATWFNQKGWQDDYTVTGGAVGGIDRGSNEEPESIKRWGNIGIVL